jgi:uncharacterized membrane protein
MKEANKWICALAYLFFFLPLLLDRKNQTYVFHANQGLNLLILSIAISIVGSIIPIIGWFIILPIGGILCFVLFVTGVINGMNEKTKELPIVGRIKLIK